MSARGGLSIPGLEASLDEDEEMKSSNMSKAEDEDEAKTGEAAGDDHNVTIKEEFIEPETTEKLEEPEVPVQVIEFELDIPTKVEPSSSPPPVPSENTLTITIPTRRAQT